jgi:predicted ATP-grasp superfamily ATP-dependent carboligase
VKQTAGRPSRRFSILCAAVKALVLEHGVNRGALAATRALGRGGWEVGVATSARGGIAYLSRHAARRHRVPGPEDLSAFVAAVAEAVERHRYDVVFPVDDAQVIALSARRAEIGAIVPYAEHDVVTRALDRLALAQGGEEAGLSVPTTRPATAEAIAALAGPEVVIKSRSYVCLGPDSGRAETWIGPPSEAAVRAGEIRAAGGDPIAQDVVRGRLMSITTLMDREGGVVAQEQQVAERIWPSPAGVSVRARTVELDAELASRVATLLARLRWWGLVQLQFLEPAGEAPRLIDLNPRFYGSFALAQASGPDFAGLWAKLATGGEVKRGAVGAAGLRYHWLIGDLRRAVSDREGGLVRDLTHSLVWAPGAVHGVWSATDPRPALQSVGTALTRRARSSRA